jgi:hypothetical protein
MRNDHLVITVFDAELEHDLSVARPSQLSNKRLRSILAGEALFVRELSLTARLLYPVRLLVRAARFSRAQPRHAATVLAHAVRIWGIR